MSKILITGASGFIGKVLYRALDFAGHELIGLSRACGDISEFQTFENIEPVEHVFHLAGHTFVPDSWKEPTTYHKTNVLGTSNVLEYCKVYGARLTFVSAYLYGEPDYLPIGEQCMAKPNNPYALSKYLAEQICQFYATYHDVDVTVIRPFNIYGVGQKEHFLIPRIMNQVKSNKTIHVMDLAPRRDYVYIDDLIDALVKTVEGISGYNVFNIGSGYSLSVQEVIDVIQTVLGTELLVVSEGKIRINEINDVYADIGKARELLGWAPNLSFQTGIERMINEENKL